MKIIVTLGEILDKGYWDDYCEETGLSEWCMNEGQADSDDEVTLTEAQAKKWGFLPSGN